MTERDAEPQRGRKNCACSRRCCLPPASRSTRRRWRADCRTASNVKDALGAAEGGIRPARRQPRAHRQEVDLPHRQRSVLAADQADVETRKLSRAAIETLAIVAYHQPVTRAEIEEIRGVATAAGTLDVLLKTGWIRPRGRRKAPGRPITYGTTETFLSHFGLEEVGDLPGLDELKGAGLLEGNLPPGFAVPLPSDDSTLRDDEDPLEPGDLDLGLAPPSSQSEK